mmetsp:Transcript_3812/g.15393  ORF Transcript_3812/g.15393 Transcript_3812/m.15393 type:complete len:224 (+) Transcript_3812:1118-1789(+)
MHGYHEHRIVVLENVLRAVAMMHIPVEDQHALAACRLRGARGDGRVVEQAESHRLGLLRVVPWGAHERHRRGRIAVRHGLRSSGGRTRREPRGQRTVLVGESIGRQIRDLGRRAYHLIPVSLSAPRRLLLLWLLGLRLRVQIGIGALCWLVVRTVLARSHCDSVELGQGAFGLFGGLGGDENDPIRAGLRPAAGRVALGFGFRDRRRVGNRSDFVHKLLCVDG